MARKVSEKSNVAYFHEKPGDDWPGEIEWDGPGFYIVDADNDDDHTNASFGRKVSWQLNEENPEGEAPDPENNEGHWVYATGSDEDGEE